MDINRKKSISKAIIDIIMLLCMIICIHTSSVFRDSKEAVRNGANPEEVFSLGTLHCIVAAFFTLIILIHVWQHWNFFKIIIKRKFFLKNKIIALTITAFVLIFVSFLPFSVQFSNSTLSFHSFIAHIFVIIIIIHFITKFKQLFSLFISKKHSIN